MPDTRANFMLLPTGHNDYSFLAISFGITPDFKGQPAIDFVYKKDDWAVSWDPDAPGFITVHQFREYSTYASFIFDNVELRPVFDIDKDRYLTALRSGNYETLFLLMYTDGAEFLGRE